MKIIAILVILLPTLGNCVIQLKNWKDCGSEAVQIENLSLTPIPNTSKTALYFRSYITREFQGKLRVLLEIKRGLFRIPWYKFKNIFKIILNIIKIITSIPLPFTGLKFGSCYYGMAFYVFFIKILSYLFKDLFKR
jgi:hypothetical protein